MNEKLLGYQDFLPKTNSRETAGAFPYSAQTPTLSSCLFVRKEYSGQSWFTRDLHPKPQHAIHRASGTLRMFPTF